MVLVKNTYNIISFKPEQSVMSVYHPPLQTTKQSNIITSLTKYLKPVCVRNE